MKATITVDKIETDLSAEDLQTSVKAGVEDSLENDDEISAYGEITVTIEE